MYTDAYLSVRSFINKISRDRIYLYSATAAFFLILSVFPFLILLLTVMQYTPLTQVFLKEQIEYALPEIIAPLLSAAIDEIYQTTYGAPIILASAVGAIWSASKGILALIRGVNQCFNVRDTRNYFVLRVWSCFYVFVFFVLMLFVLIVPSFGSFVYSLVQPYLGTMNSALRFIIKQRYLITLVVMLFLLMLLYKFLPAKHNKFLRMFPGALIACGALFLLSKLISLYVKLFPNISYTYGSLTTFIVAMLYLYFAAYIIFICAELNFFMDIWFEMRLRKHLRDKARKYEEKMETRRLTAQQMRDFIRIRKRLERLGIRQRANAGTSSDDEAFRTDG